MSKKVSLNDIEQELENLSDIEVQQLASGLVALKAKCPKIVEAYAWTGLFSAVGIEAIAANHTRTKAKGMSKAKPQTISAKELRLLSATNSPRLPRFINDKGIRKEWVGIGWVSLDGKPELSDTLVK